MIDPRQIVTVLVAALLVVSAGCGKKNKPEKNAATKSAEAGTTEKLATESAKPPPLPKHKVFATARQALEEILESKPRVIGFGEYHELKSSAKVQSTVHRFTVDMLDLLAGRASDLIVETWVEAGKCGESEQRVSKDVRKVTERPKHTQNELVRLIERARELKIQAHFLELLCDDYKAVLPDGKEVDYEKLLILVTDKLRDKALEALARGDKEKLITLYGGSTHNDLYPDIAKFSYAAAVKEKSDGGYVEIDLYVPEYIDRSKYIPEEPWYPLYKELSSEKEVLLIERGPSSYIIVLKRGLARTK